ncbi:N-terminal EF-hand calcium-binding protein 3 isoform X2 [Talpa occidentalis]|uniref:N-terminal EF-hand calcium-binding protein 3 isoform X2 n=1 Tax=Talpa occidentalis TaxID=50954 RepID=UPI0023F9E69D|nr:N-terminal EF-hand calcium-binding protein 3 isoform X2 [Talpa occidentalis]
MMSLCPALCLQGVLLPLPSPGSHIVTSWFDLTICRLEHLTGKSVTSGLYFLAVTLSKDQKSGNVYKEYEQASKVDQFVTRFLLRETVSQLQALQSSLEGASDTLEAQARGLRSDEESVEVQHRPRGSRRAGRKALRSISWSPTSSPGSSDIGRSSEAEMQWQLQVNRLQELIDQLECKAPRLEPLHEEEFTKESDSHILVAQRQVQVAEEALQDFHRALCCYVDFTGAQSHCLHVSARKRLDSASFTLYEFWQDEASWRRHQQSACSKAFQRILIDHLQAPDTLTTVFFPASWWIMNNN